MFWGNLGESPPLCGLDKTLAERGRWVITELEGVLTAGYGWESRYVSGVIKECMELP